MKTQKLRKLFEWGRKHLDSVSNPLPQGTLWGKKKKPESEAGRILRKTRELFEQTHWIQGRFAYYEGMKTKYCLVGGLRASAGLRPQLSYSDDSSVPRAYTKAYHALEEVLQVEDLIGWNDRKGRTVEEVIGVLKMAEGRV